MATEKIIRDYAIQDLEDRGFISWYPPKVKYRKETDIFGCFDLLALNNEIVYLIQLTTLSNIRSREKKIKKFISKNNLEFSSFDRHLLIEVWGWNEKKHQFKTISI